MLFDDPRSIHLGCDLLKICGVARINPQSEGDCNSTSLMAVIKIVGEKPRHQESDFPDVRAVADKSPGDELE